LGKKWLHVLTTEPNWPKKRSYKEIFKNPKFIITTYKKGKIKSLPADVTPFLLKHQQPTQG
jgi:hypothetical protein